MNFAQPGKLAHLYALLFLGCAVLFAFYRWQFAAQAEEATALTSLSAVLKLDGIQKPDPEIRSVRRGATTVPELLSRIQEIASEHGIIIRSVTPSPLNPDQITIGTEGGFRDLMRLMARLETLQVSISSFDITPSDHGDTATIGITRTTKAGAPESFADYIDAIAIYSAVRDPFEIGDPIPLPNVPPDLGDISWTYHLTSISLLGAERVATIDGKDYKDGDSFSGMTVTGISPSSVTLASPKQTIPQVLHFRDNPGPSDAAH